MYYAIGVSVPSLHRESTDSLIYKYDCVDSRDYTQSCTAQYAHSKYVSQCTLTSRTTALPMLPWRTAFAALA